mmetsp:Transcript_31492/g.61440  ORF Transcript_31492/g.61440 Transcript_31492/m.61440 type:complete len:902 (-) Transcript_31492:117-2822(-)
MLFFSPFSSLLSHSFFFVSFCRSPRLDKKKSPHGPLRENEISISSPKVAKTKFLHSDVGLGKEKKGTAPVGRPDSRSDVYGIGGGKGREGSRLLPLGHTLLKSAGHSLPAGRSVTSLGGDWLTSFSRPSTSQLAPVAATPTPHTPEPSHHIAGTFAQANVGKNYEDGHRVIETSHPIIKLAKKGDWIHLQKILEKVPEKNMQGFVNQIDKNGSSALFFAVNSGHYNATALLLNGRADPNLKNLLAITPLHLACQHQQNVLIKLLVRFGAKPDIVNNENQLCWQMAEPEMAVPLQSLLRRCMIDPQADFTRTSLKDHEDWNKYLNQLPRSRRMGSTTDDTLDIDAVSLLANETLLADDPVLSAIETGSWELLVTIFRNVADANNPEDSEPDSGLERFANRVDKTGTSALMFAAWCEDSRERSVKVLLNNGADPNLANHSGNTALHLACERENRAVIKLLVRFGAKVDAVNIIGDTCAQMQAYRPLDAKTKQAGISEREAAMPLPQFLSYCSVKYGPCPFSDLTLDLDDFSSDEDEDGYLDDILRRLRQFRKEEAEATQNRENLPVGSKTHRKGSRCSDPDAQTKKIDLFSAAAAGDVESIKYFFQVEWNRSYMEQKQFVNLRNSEKQETALFSAIRAGSLEVTSLLLYYESSPNVQNVNGDTPLHVACHLHHMPIAQEIINNGGLTTIKNKQGKLCSDLLPSEIDGEATDRSVDEELLERWVQDLALAGEQFSDSEAENEFESVAPPKEKQKILKGKQAGKSSVEKSVGNSPTHSRGGSMTKVTSLHSSRRNSKHTAQSSDAVPGVLSSMTEEKPWVVSASPMKSTNSSRAPSRTSAVTAIAEGVNEELESGGENPQTPKLAARKPSPSMQPINEVTKLDKSDQASRSTFSLTEVDQASTSS